MTVEIRGAEPADAASIAALAAETFALACPPETSDAAIEEFISQNLTTGHFEGYLADPARDIRLVFDDGMLAGYTMLVFQEPGDADVASAITARPTAELSKVYLLSRHHGAGIAATLMAATLDVARARGAAGVWLGVNQKNARAIRFYEKSGFTTVGTKTFMVGPVLHDDYVMEQLL
jgi:ribosomal protein S18 acetylase RimI-like enzyme